MLKGYIANLGKYNEGFLIGEWVEFPISEEELEAVYVSPTFTSRDGLAYASFTSTRLLRTASAASLRVLKMRTAHRYLSSLTSISKSLYLYLFEATAARAYLARPVC